MATVDPILAGCELFAGVPGADLARLAAVCELRVVPRDAVLFRMGQRAEQLFALRHGRVLLSVSLRIDDADHDLTLDERIPPQLVGWSALVPPHQYTLSARTTRDTELFVFDRAPLLDALQRAPEVGHRVMCNLAGVMARRFHQAQALWMRELQRGIDARRY